MAVPRDNPLKPPTVSVKRVRIIGERPMKDASVAPAAVEDMAQSAEQAAAYLKTLAHEGRLMILCHLGAGEKSVGELESLLNIRQAAVSQMLARLRDENLVKTRRDGLPDYR